MNHIVYSNMTVKEEYRLNGKLCGATIERIIDQQHDISNFYELKGSIDTLAKEAKSCYAPEDCLTDVIQELNTMNVKGNNKLIIENVIEKLRDIENDLYQSGDYGTSELNKIIELMKKGTE